jgi:molybdate transport system ATP-binding protein
MSTQEHQVRVRLERPAFTLNVDLVLPAQGITAIFGPSGSGKTSLLRCVAGLEKSPSAFIRIAHQVWQDDAHAFFLPTWQRPLGYVFQEASLFEHLDVRANLRYGLQRAASKDAQAFESIIALLGIGPLMNRRPHQLSGGERQRVAMARALASQPQLLLLDEPLASLDHAKRQEILPWLERMRDELRMPMLYVTHAVDEVVRLANHLVVLEQGLVKAQGPMAEVLAQVDKPVVLGEDLGVVMEGVIAEKDPRWSLMRVELPHVVLWLSDSGQALGTRVRLRVLARDVSITLSQAQHTSIQNHWPCVVSAIVPAQHDSQVLVQMALGEQLLLARTTARAAHALGLTPGQAVWAQVKSAALVSGSMDTRAETPLH